MANKELDDSVNALALRIESLESRNAFQDDVIDQLNQEISIHQSQLAELQQQLKLIASRIKDGTSGQLDKEEVEPPPPHY